MTREELEVNAAIKRIPRALDEVVKQADRMASAMERIAAHLERGESHIELTPPPPPFHTDSRPSP